MCSRHPTAASHRGHCTACLLEDALAPIPPAPLPPRNLVIQLPLGRTISSSVFLATSAVAPFRLFRLKTWPIAAPPDFMARFQRLQQALSAWNSGAIRPPLAAWVDVSHHPWVLSEFNQGLPIVEQVQSGALDRVDAEACLET